MAKTKLWISPTLELRHSVNGWPDSLYWPNDAVIGLSHKQVEDVNKQLSQAKADSILVVDFYESGAPDSFIDVQCEVSIIFQALQGEVWADVIQSYYDKMHRKQPDRFRKVGRLKPVNAPELHNVFKDINADKYNQHYKGDAAWNGLRARILDEFTHSWQTDGSRYPDPIVTLEITLDKLGIK